MQTSYRSRRALELMSRLRQAERSHCCLVPTTRFEGDVLSRATAKGELVSPMRSMYARPDYWLLLSPHEQVLHCLHTLQRDHPLWRFIGPTAAVVHGLDVPEPYLWPIRVAARRGSHHRSTSQIAYLLIAEDNFELVDRLRVTSIERSAFDCMCEMDFADALAVADSVLRVGGCDALRFKETVDAMSGTAQGGLYARRVAQFVSERSLEADEARARGLSLWQGFSAPRLWEMVQVGDGTLVSGALGWLRDDGSWVLATPDKRMPTGWSVDADTNDLCKLRFSSNLTDTPKAFATMLEDAGVPRPKEQLLAEGEEPRRRLLLGRGRNERLALARA